MLLSDVLFLSVRINNMPTSNQLIKRGRKARVKKLKTGALRDNFNTINNRFTKTINPIKKGVVTVVKTMTPKNPILPCEKFAKSNSAIVI